MVSVRKIRNDRESRLAVCIGFNSPLRQYFGLFRAVSIV